MGFVPAILSLKQTFQLNLRGFTGSESGNRAVSLSLTLLAFGLYNE